MSPPLTLIIVKDISQSFVNDSSFFFFYFLHCQFYTHKLLFSLFLSLILLSRFPFTITTPIYTTYIIITFSSFGWKTLFNFFLLSNSCYCCFLWIKLSIFFSFLTCNCIKSQMHLLTSYLIPLLEQ